MRSRLVLASLFATLALSCAAGGGDDSSAAKKAPNDFGDRSLATPTPQRGGASRDGEVTGGAPWPTGDQGAVPDADLSTQLFDSSIFPGVTYAGDIGVTGGRVYWQIADAAHRTGIASAPADSGLGVTPDLVIAPTDGLLYAVDAHVVFQASGGPVRVVRAGSVTVETLADSTLDCTAHTSDDGDVYCRTATGELVAWDLATGAKRTVYQGIPAGRWLQVDDASFYVAYLVDVTIGTTTWTTYTIARLPKPASWEATRTAEPEPIIERQLDPSRFMVRAGWMTWNFNGASAHAHQSNAVPVSGGVPTAVAYGETTGFAIPDAYAPGTMWATHVLEGACTITKADVESQSVYVGAKTTFAGIATDATYLWFTHPDGTVWRAPKR